MDWLITMPAWGARCLDSFVENALPAIDAARHGISGKIRFIVHTDQPWLIDEVLQGYQRIIRPVPPSHNAHISFGDASREALEEARDGECVAIINPDMVCSREIFAAAERRFAQGKRLIMMAASRTAGGAPPPGAPSAEILDWTMQHRHPSIQECFWGTGRSHIPWAIYFERGEEIVLHGFHLHPFALMKDRNLAFEGTVDLDLPDNFKTDEIHVVTDRNEAAFAELSPPERIFSLIPHPLTIDDVAQWAHYHARPMHRWLFSHQITIKGNGGDAEAAAIAEKILQSIV